MYIVLAAGDPLAPWGQAAAIVILLYMVIVVVISLGLAFGLMFAFSLVRDKVELVKKIRPTVNNINETSEAAMKGTLPEAGAAENKVVRAVAQIPAYAHTAEQKVEQGSDRVAQVVIEFRARTEMAKQVVKAFFLPGLTRRPQTALEQEGVGFKSPGYRMLVEEKAPEAAPGEVGDGYIRGIKPSEIREEPVEVVTAPPPELQQASAPGQVQGRNEPTPPAP